MAPHVRLEHRTERGEGSAPTEDTHEFFRELSPPTLDWSGSCRSDGCSSLFFWFVGFSFCSAGDGTQRLCRLQIFIGSKKSTALSVLTADRLKTQTSLVWNDSGTTYPAFNT